MESMYIFIGTLLIAVTVWALKPLFKRKEKFKGSVKEQKILSQQKIKPFNYRKSRSKTSTSFYQEWFKNKYQKRKLYHIFMWLNNKKYTQFTVATSGKEFIYQGGLYMIDPDMSREDIAVGNNTLMYHQGVSTPFKIDFDIDQLRKTLENDKFTDSNIIKAINPTSLKEWMNSSIVEKILKGQELSQEMKMIKMFVIIGLLVSGINLILMLKQSGIIK